MCSGRGLRATSFIPILLLVVVTKLYFGELVNVFAEVYCTLGRVVPAVPTREIIEY